MSGPTRAEVCVVACAEVFRGDGAIVCSPMGTVPRLGALLARATFEPDLLITDGEAYLIADDAPLGREAQATVEGWLPFRMVFDLLAAGRRHVMMGASQLDRYGNQNISAIGDWSRPKVQLLGMRGAPGNTANHATSYWVGNHSPRVFVERVDVVSGVGTDRARAHPEVIGHVRAIVTDLAVLDLGGADGRVRLVSTHPGVSIEDVIAATGFELEIPTTVPETRRPTDDELRLIRDVLDPSGSRDAEVSSG